MRRDYTVLLTTLIVFTFVISGFLLLGTLDATQTEPSDCEPWFKKECSPKQEGQLPECCPNSRPLHAERSEVKRGIFLIRRIY